MARIGDKERDQAQTQLTDAFAEGKLSMSEYETRTEAIQSAETNEQLAASLEDLAIVAAAGADTQPLAARESRKATAIFGAAVRKGRWRLAERFKTLTVFGGCELDLRDADLPRESAIHIKVIFGGVEIIAPPDVEIVNDVTAIFGASEVATDPDAPETFTKRVRLKGLVFFGGVEVSVRRPGESARQASKRRNLAKKAQRKQLTG